MANALAIHDPLRINLSRQTNILISTIPRDNELWYSLQNVPTTTKLLSILSAILADLSYTKIVANLFRPILIDLCARWLESERDTEQHLFALCYLLEVHEEVFPILNELLLKYYENGPLSMITGEYLSLSTQKIRLQQFLLAYFRILQANRELPNLLQWSLSPLSKLIWTPFVDNGVRLLAIRCYSLQSGMGEAERLKLEYEVLGEPCSAQCQLIYGKNIDGTKTEVDGWLLPIAELRRIKEERDDILADDMNFFQEEGTDQLLSYTDADLSPFVVNVHGILLLRFSMGLRISSQFIPLSTSSQALQQLALNLSLCVPTLLISSPSAGKSLLLSHLSELVHPDSQNQIVTIQLADTSIDPRSLLGSYISSPIHPGRFVWQEGLLIRSMREGKWVVLEDIDKANNEVLGVIKPLVESLNIGKWIGGRARIDVPSRGTVIAHHKFMLFATSSVTPSGSAVTHPPVFFGSYKFSEVILHPPSEVELTVIIGSKFPRFGGKTTLAIIELWNSIREISRPSSSREIGLRELQKFCGRLNKILPSSYQPIHISNDSSNSMAVPTMGDTFLNPSLREDIFLEARDVFFSSGTWTSVTRAYIDAIRRTVGVHLRLDSERQEWVLYGKSFELELEKRESGIINAIHIGHTRLSASLNTKELLSTKGRPFALHKPALTLLSRIANAISHGEPILLTGETGTGKTSTISYLVSLLHRSLISLNLSHQTESSDLIGGLKPIDARIPGSTLQENFLQLFDATFSRRKNERFETEVRKAVNDCKWKRAVGLWKESVRLALERISVRKTERLNLLDDETPRKRRKTHKPESKPLEDRWSNFLLDVEEFEIRHVHGEGKFAFGFVEGPLIKAVRYGHWILLDEINLASPEALECISDLLRDPFASITLTEHGSLEPIPRHPDFRLFACMNPATDVGKKDISSTLRSRFTEIDVQPADGDKDTLLSIISQYIGHIVVGDKGIILDIAEFYMAVKKIEESRQLADGSNHRPHFSMRTLVRALTFASDTASMYSLRRSIWEGCLMTFTMSLDKESAEIVVALARKLLLSGVRNVGSFLAKDPAFPLEGDYVKFGPFYLEKGPIRDLQTEEYIMTTSVEQKLVNLARIALTRRYPVLIEGPTSSGKTSSIEYLAKRTGHHFVRINNHEHTDIQEYLGSYISDPATGKLVYRDGLLVQALRHGHWIVLDELNLAPTDVLEALNRLLDDNRELFIPETHEVIQPHPHFMLFATQNPPGLYAGRKILSRAFRNRFLEVHFEDFPQIELETILCQRCRIAPSYGKRIVGVFHELQKRRQSGRVFESKQSFVTLRDLFRWAGRDAVGYQELADNGYMLLAERTRRPEDRAVVKEVIELVMGVKIDEHNIYNILKPGTDMDSYLGHSVPDNANVVWTKSMRRLYTLVCRALKFNEPVLLVGETGSGKTSVCQIFSEASSKRLLALNCHQNTETADIIGGLRPVRNRSVLRAELLRDAHAILKSVGINTNLPTIDSLDALLSSVLKMPGLDSSTRDTLEVIEKKAVQLKSIFEWHNGPLIDAMCHGDVFLLDEISLADDSVLERLNSVLEPGRAIVLAERGGINSGEAYIPASEEFKIIATMNPGGDYGKKELSPSLRNRFTEIWVPSVNDKEDFEMIVNNMWETASLLPYTKVVLDFMEWLCDRVGDRSLLSLRDIQSLVIFINSVYKEQIDKTNRIHINELFHHAIHMTFLDGLSSQPQLATFSRDSLEQLKVDALVKLQELVPLLEPLAASFPVYDPAAFFQLGPFAIKMGTRRSANLSFNLSAPTTQNNAMRIIRACQVIKPILLEGSPGVGKTSLITALANLSGNELCRINLSDQTDLMDLFGSDLPVEGGNIGEFAWKDAEFLKALQEGHWVLLDEMNLAPQAVLEGLNAVLDHRGTVYIPELNRSFQRHPSFRIFAAQNPLHQGGGRKGLPKSFLNRFSKVYIDELTPRDLFIVCSQMFPDVEEMTLHNMISFNTHLNDKITQQRTFGHDGSPWEFNLRDVIRWCTLISTDISHRSPENYLESVYLLRFRSIHDRLSARSIFDEKFLLSSRHERAPPWTISSSIVQFGHYITARKSGISKARPRRILKMQLSALQSLGDCVSRSWLAILTGPRNSGKTDVVRTLAHFTGNPLTEVYLNSSTDTMDILGSFEQVDVQRRLSTLIDDMSCALENDLQSVFGSKEMSDFHVRVNFLQHYCANLHRDDYIQLLCDNLLAVLSDIIALGPPTLTKYKEIKFLVEKFATWQSSAGQFEWVDGPLVKAMKNGNWLLLDDANLCGPSVLDRLNSLCETNGFLILSERGFVEGRVQIVQPHPNFRLFMSVDPHYGELSRAMRNRGIEISLLWNPISDDLSILSDHYRLPSALQLLSENYRVQTTMFEAFRRGLLDRTLSSPRSLTSSGHSFDQDSALSSLVDQSPALFPDLSTDDYSWVFFLHRSLPPKHMAFLNRYHLSQFFGRKVPEAIKGFLNTFPRQEVTTALEPYRGTYADHKDVSLDSILSQPMDFFWNEGLAQMGCEAPAIRLMLLETLNISAALFICEQNNCFALEPAQVRKKKNIDAHRTVEALVNSLLQLGRQLLRLSSSETDLLSLKLISSLLLSSVHLQMALRTSSYDFSALHAICNWLLGLLDNSPAIFLSVTNRAKELHRVISLSTGLGIFAIWSCFYHEELPSSVQDNMCKINMLASNLTSSPKTYALRRQSYDMMSLISLPTSLMSPTSQELGNLKMLLETALSPNIIEGNIKPNFLVDHNSLILELHILALFSWNPDMQRLHHVMNVMVKHSCTDSDASLLRLIPYQHLVWAADVGTASTPLIVRAQISWFQGLWNAKHDNRVVGPAILLYPISLSKVVELCDMERVPLRSLESYEDILRRQVSFTIVESQNESDRITDLTSILLESLFIISSSVPTSFDGVLFEKVKNEAFNTKTDLPRSFHVVLSFLLKSGDEYFVKCLKEELVPLASSMLGKPSIQIMGLAWIKISRLILKLFTPDSPIDPRNIESFSYQRIKYNETNLMSQLRLHRRLEELITGNTENDVTFHLASQLDIIHEQLAKSPAIPTRDDVPRLHLFWSEVVQFQNNVLSKVDDLVEGLFNDDSNANLREGVMQESLASFCRRLDSSYPDFVDICIPLKLAFLYMRFGLRLTLESSPSNLKRKSESDLSTSLFLFPSARCSSEIIASFKNVHPSDSQACNRILLSLAAFSMQISIGLKPESDFSWLEMAYEQMVRLWLIDCANEKQRTNEASTLYRKSRLDYQAETEADIEEEEFLRIFPTFEVAVEVERPSCSSESTSALHVEPRNMTTLLYIHHDIMGYSTCDTVSSRFAGIRAAAIQRFVKNSLQSMPGHLDKSALPFQFTILHDSIVSLDAERTPEDFTYNFYFDANYKELKQSASVVEALRYRLQAIASDWPDQMVLQHLIERCDAILCINSCSPVAKVLAMVEQLLVQSEDWEMYSNKENSVKTHQEELIHLVVHWRQLELICWKNILNMQAKLFHEELAEWWFRLYDALIRGSLSAAVLQNSDSCEQSLDRYLEDLVPLLQTFLRSSPLGQFHSRLQLIQSFEQYIVKLHPLKSLTEKTTLERVHCILNASHRYYNLFSARLQKRLSDEKGKLESEVKVVIKLASWKDVNVQALKQSAQRSHRQLHKIIKRFRAILRQPVEDQMQPYLADEGESRSLAIDKFSFAESAINIRLKFLGQVGIRLPKYLVNITATFEKYKTILRQQLGPFIQSYLTHAPQMVDDLATEIITTLKELSSLSLPSKPLELRKKRQKEFLVRKRKAWSDMLKELKRAGLASNCKPETLRQNMSPRWISEQPAYSMTLSFGPEVAKVEAYFVKLCGSLPILRESLQNHHPDITTRELQRGQMFLESGFSIAIDLRSRLITSLKIYQRMQGTLQRLRILASSDKILLLSMDASTLMSSAKDCLFKVSHGLLDLRDNLSIINRLDPSRKTHAISQEVSLAFNATESLREQFNSLFNNWQTHIVLPFLTQDESYFLLQLKKHLAEIRCSLLEWLKQNSNLKHLLFPLLEWVEGQKMLDLISMPWESTSESAKLEVLLKSLLVSVQSMVSQIPQNDELHDTLAEKYITKGSQIARDFTLLSNLNSISSQLDELLLELPYQINFLDSLNILLPFLNVYLEFVKDQLTGLSNWMKVLFKLCFVLCSVLQSLCQQGFCQPHEEDGESDDVANGAEGVGIGEGSGSDNISKEIQDEGQIEGLQGEDKESKEDDSGNDHGDAIEMDENFSGALEDKSYSNSEDETGSDDGLNSEIDETIGNLDQLDMSAVDEKMWGDEGSVGQSKDDTEKLEQNNSKQGGNSEMVAKDNEKTSAKEQKEDQPLESDDVDMEAQEAESENSDLTNSQVNGAPKVDFVQDVNTLDLPEELDLGDDLEKENVLPHGDDDQMKDDQPNENPELENDSNLGIDPNFIAEEGSTELNDKDKFPPPEFNEVGEEDDSKFDGEALDEVVAKPDISIGNGNGDPGNIPQSSESENSMKAASGGTQGTAGEETSAEELNVNDERPLQIAPPLGNDLAGTIGSDSTAAGVQRGRDPSQSQVQPLPNPLRSLGDSLRQIQRVMEEILNSDQNNPVKNINEADMGNKMEYSHPDVIDHDIQALGPAGENQVAKLNQLAFVDSEMDIENAVAMDVDETPITIGDDSHSPPSTQANVTSTPAPTNALEGAILNNPGPFEHISSSSDIQNFGRTGEFDEGNDPGVEAQLQQWRNADYPEEGSERIWRLYESLTHDLAYLLSEQLRLILEPTLATRLKGDYRTGKRLNMKRVISYIASDYSKDKIWLRRTKPSQREYQVLISVDDSKSMAESHSIHLAYQTLALISKALSRLESGDVAIAKFGETVDLIHGFEEGPFSDQAGRKLLSAFKFTQKATNVFSLLDTTLRILETARERKAMNSSSAADLWQLQIIISDGICQDHDKLRNILRKAEEQRVMVVFIVMDSLQAVQVASTEPGSSARAKHGSILHMDKAEFKSIDGKMELYLRKYLDSFPFQYYVVLRDAEALPDVLAVTLKQFFERITEE